MKYRKTHTYKYELEESLTMLLPNSLKVGGLIDFNYLFVTEAGGLLIKQHYRWDGPSGPAIDSKNFMRGSLVHDALYQLIREGYLDKSARKEADKLLQQHCREDGMSWLRAKWVYGAVRAFGGPSVKKKNYPVLEAP